MPVMDLSTGVLEKIKNDCQIVRRIKATKMTE